MQINTPVNSQENNVSGNLQGNAVQCAQRINPGNTQRNTDGHMVRIKGKTGGNRQAIVIQNDQGCIQKETSRNIADNITQDTSPNTINSLHLERHSNPKPYLLALWHFFHFMAYLILFVFFILMIIFLVKYRLLEFSFIPDTLVSRIKIKINPLCGPSRNSSGSFETQIWLSC